MNTTKKVSFIEFAQIVGAAAIACYAVATLVGWQTTRGYYEYLGAPWIIDLIDIPFFARNAAPYLTPTIIAFLALLALHMQGALKERGILIITVAVAGLSVALMAYTSLKPTTDFTFTYIGFSLYCIAIGSSAAFIYANLATQEKSISISAVWIVCIGFNLTITFIPRAFGQSAAHHLIGQYQTLPIARISGDTSALVWRVVDVINDKFILVANHNTPARIIRVVPVEDVEGVTPLTDAPKRSS